VLAALCVGVGCAIWLPGNHAEPASVRFEKTTSGGTWSAPPENSRHVQVREHRVLGIHVTEVVLGRASIDDELPMVISFHGRGSRPNVPSGDHAETLPVRLILPRADQALGTGYSWWPISITAGRDKVLGHQIRERTAELARLVSRLRSLRPTEGKPLVSGFSQGGMISFALAVLHPEVVDSAYPICGWIPPMLLAEADASLSATVHAIHAEEDPIVPMEPTRSLIRALREAGVQAEMHAFPGDEHRITTEMRDRHRDLMLRRIRERRAAARDLG